jgi:UDP-N-acetylmuramate--alanine ligase
MDDFAKELSNVEELLLMEIYPARELPMVGITSSVLLEKIDIKNKKVVKREDLMEEIRTKDIGVLMTLGAGDIDVFVPQITEWINRK